MPLGAFRLNTLSSATAGVSPVAGYILELSAATYNESNSYGGIDIDSSGNIIMAVRLSESFSVNRTAIIKISPSAQILWQRVFSHNNNDEFYEFLLLSNGNVVVSYTQGVNAKISVFNGSDGSTIFTRIFAVEAGNFSPITGLGKDNNDNIYIAARESNQGLLYYYKYNSTGTLLNGPNRYRSNPQSGVPPIISDPYVSSVGNTLFSVSRGNVSGISNDPVIYFASLTSTSTLSVITTYGRTNNLFPNSMTQDASNNVYIKHDERSIIKFNSSGTIQWQKSYGSGVGSFSSKMTVDSQNLYCSSAVNNLLIIYCISLSTGDIVWQNQLSKSSSSFVVTQHGITVDNNLVYVSSHNSSNNQRIIAALPKDGTGLGNYGTYTLSASTAAVASNTSYATMSNSFIQPTNNISISSPSITNNAANYTLTQITQ
jgi:outer membrane protein assembly factor BamB